MHHRLWDHTVTIHAGKEPKKREKLHIQENRTCLTLQKLNHYKQCSNYRWLILPFVLTCIATSFGRLWGGCVMAKWGSIRWGLLISLRTHLLISSMIRAWMAKSGQHRCGPCNSSELSMGYQSHLHALLMHILVHACAQHQNTSSTLTYKPPPSWDQPSLAQLLPYSNYPNPTDWLRSKVTYL